MFNRQEQALAAKIAMRNIGLYKIKSLTIGALICFGTFLIVFGLNLLRNVESSMQESIISSVAGHVQVYAKNAKDSLALFGGSFMGREDIGTLPRFEDVSSVIEENPLVQAVVPMGFDMAFLGRGNELDEVFDALRLAIKQGDKTGIDEAIQHAKHQISIAKTELGELVKVSSNREEVEQQIRQIESTESPGFWEKLTTPSSEDTLQYLETKVAPLSGEKQPIYLRYLGTDIPKFIANFKKFSIKEGTVVPANTRGIMVSHKFREDYLKNIPARYFDRLYRAKTISKTTISKDAETKLWASDLARQYMQILVYLDGKESVALHEELNAYLKTNASLEELVKQFLKVDDDNIVDRHAFFYKNVAPKIKLYEINIGDNLIMRSYTRSGFIKTLPIKVYGVYGFAGLEESDLAGGFNIIDLVSFRELYGEMDENAKKELEALRQNAKIKEVTSENIEDSLFGEGAQIESQSASIANNDVSVSAQMIEAADARSNEFLPTEVNGGLALNLAVVLKQGGTSNIERVKSQLTSEFEAQKIEMKAVDWQEASGFVGQFVGIVRIVLVIGVLIIFLVALVIINNTLVVATLDRSREIGTMRAIGADKSFILSLFLWETFGIASLGALAGTLLAGTALFYFGIKGIPAGHDVVVFLFSGLRLYPKIELILMFVLPCLIVLLALLSSLYSARFAARVTPVTAMQEKE